MVYNDNNIDADVENIINKYKSAFGIDVLTEKDVEILTSILERKLTQLTRRRK